MSFVAFEQRGPIGVLTMNRPEALNALTADVLRDLGEAMDSSQPPPRAKPLTAAMTGLGKFSSFKKTWLP